MLKAPIPALAKAREASKATPQPLGGPSIDSGNGGHMGERAGSGAGPGTVWPGASRPALAQRCERMAVATGLIAVS